MGGATQPTWREALEHGSSYQRETTHISTMSPTLDLVCEKREREGERRREKEREREERERERRGELMTKFSELCRSIISSSLHTN
jgi:hypothetical protein